MKVIAAYDKITADKVMKTISLPPFADILASATFLDLFSSIQRQRTAHFEDGWRTRDFSIEFIW